MERKITQSLSMFRAFKRDGGRKKRRRLVMDGTLRIKT